MSGAHVLITGGAGYIGSHAVLALRDIGRDVVVIDDLSTGVRDAIPEGMPFHQGDVADSAFLLAVFAQHRIDAVMHFAGSISVPESVADPAKYYRNNTCATLSLARDCLGAGIDRFIFSSTAAVYGNPESSPISEEATPRPLSPYGASKLMAETMLGDLSRSKPAFRAICLRYFNVAGADPAGRAGQRSVEAIGLVRFVVEVALGKRAWLEIFGDDYPTRDGTGERDYIHVSDLVQAHVAALEHLEAGGGGGVMNCGYGKGVTVLEVVAALEAILGRPIARRRLPRRPGDPASSVSDVRKLMTTLRWTPRFGSLDDILKSALAWHGGSVPRRQDTAAGVGQAR